MGWRCSATPSCTAQARTQSLYTASHAAHSSMLVLLCTGAVALAKALAENKGLKRFVISDNYIGTLGASTIAGALAQNTRVESLALRNCELSDAGAERLCQALLVRFLSRGYCAIACFLGCGCGALLPGATSTFARAYNGVSARDARVCKTCSDADRVAHCEAMNARQQA